MSLVFIKLLIKLTQINNLQWSYLTLNIQGIYIKFDYFINFYFDSIRLSYLSEKSRNLVLLLFPWKWHYIIILIFKNKLFYLIKKLNKKNFYLKSIFCTYFFSTILNDFS